MQGLDGAAPPRPAGAGAWDGGGPRALAARRRRPSLPQIFPLSPGSRWQSSSARPAALALQQALGRELALVRRGSPEVLGVSVRLLQALATLLSSPHGGALALSMQRSHFLACPLLRQLRQYQVGAAAAGTAAGCLTPRGLGVRTLPCGLVLGSRVQGGRQAVPLLGELVRQKGDGAGWSAVSLPLRLARFATAAPSAYAHVRGASRLVFVSV